MKTRIITAVVGVALLVGVFALYMTPVFDLAVLVLCLLALWEIYNALQFGKENAFVLIATAAFTVLALLGIGQGHLLQIPTGIYVLVVALCAYTILRGGKLNFEMTSTLILYYGMVMLCFGSWIYLKYRLPRETHQFDAVFFTVLSMFIAWGGDSCAYFAGRAFGKHKLLPSVSPHKTVEGAIGGVLGSACFTVLATWAYGTCFRHAVAQRSGPAFYVILALVGAAGSILGIFGDLLASIIKRENNIKDYGKILPGHGGVMDRFDSLIFIAPLVTTIGVILVG